MPDSSDLDYNPNNKNDIDDRRKKCTKRKKRNAGGRNVGPKLTIYQCSLCSYRTGLRTILKRHFAVCFSKPKAMRHQSKAVNIANLMKHKTSHFSRIQNGLVECSHCDLTFFTMAECKKHMNEQSDLYETKSIEENMSLMAASDNQKLRSSHIMHNNSSNSTEVNGSLYSCWCGVFQSASRSQYLHHLKRIHSINFDSFEEINENDEATTETKTENGQATEEIGCPMPDCSFHTDNEDDLELHLTHRHELDYDHIEIGVIRDETTQSKTLRPNEKIEKTDQQQNSGLSDMEMLEDLQKQVKFIEVYAANDEDDSDLTETDEVLEKTESFICGWCAYETTDNLHLEFHNCLLHNSNNVFVCPQTDCLFQSKNQSSFKVHVLVTHQFSDSAKIPVNGSLMAHQLNGIKTGQSHQINIDPNISEWIQAVEDDVQDTNIHSDESETIRIEIVEDQTDNTTAEDSLENNVKKSSLLIKCLNKGCDYYSRYDSDSIRKHINICSKKTKAFEATSKSELCEQEKTPCPIHKQERSSENMLLQQADLSKSDNVTYKCLMCNTVISHRYTLKNHAHIHGREESNFDLIVGFSQFKGDAKLNTIKIKCDSNLIPRESSNVPKYKNDEKALNIGPLLLGYDPNLPVFSCTECNFKSNAIEMLDKHQSLHWNAEKDAAYAAKQWHTCEICFYYCFDAVRFKQHEEIHKKTSSFL